MGQIQNAVLQAMGAIGQGLQVGKFLRTQDPNWQAKQRQKIEERDTAARIQYRKDRAANALEAGSAEATETGIENVEDAKKIIADLGGRKEARAQMGDYEKQAFYAYQRSNQSQQTQAWRHYNTISEALELTARSKGREAAKNAAKGGKK